MKCSLSVLFLASWYLTGYTTLSQYVEPAWWPAIEATFVGVNLQQCEKRENAVPSSGGSCSRKSKTCFFGEQTCDGEPYPDTRCVCNFRTWQCEPVLCPGGTVAPTEPPLPSDSCTNVLIDFETRDDGSSLTAGDYLDGSEWVARYGIKVTASSTSGGFTPNNRPRLFNAASPGTAAEGDPDLGSPNEACSPSGQGIGVGGAPGTLGENCLPQGLVLIIQEHDTVYPDDNAAGGTITFDFEYPTDVRSVGLMDIEPGAIATFVSITRANGVVLSVDAQGLGGNSVQNVPIFVEDAIQVQITFGTSGAVTNLDMCATALTVAPVTPTVAPFTAGSPVNSCTESAVCDDNATCQLNRDGVLGCECNHGYIGNGEMCVTFIPLDDCGSFTSISTYGRRVERLSNLNCAGTICFEEISLHSSFNFSWAGVESVTRVTVTDDGFLCFLDGCMDAIDVTSVNLNAHNSGGSVFVALGPTVTVISWEGVSLDSPDPAANDLISFQAVLHEDGKVDMRWESGELQFMRAGLTVDMNFIPVTGSPFRDDNSGQSFEYPTNQCRRFVPNAASYTQGE